MIHLHNDNRAKIITKRQIQGELGGGSSYSIPNTNSTNPTGANNSYNCDYVTLVQTTLSGTQTVDGESPSNGASILVANQTSAIENGIYTYSSSGAWERVDGLGSGNQITILGGTKQGTIWVVETASFVIGTDNISIIESAISRKDESFSLGFDAVTSLMTSDIGLFQVSDNSIMSATVQDIMDTYGAKGLWDAVTIKTADQDYENSDVLTDVTELTIDLDADELYDFIFEILADKIGLGYGGLAIIQVHYTGTFEDGNYNKGGYDGEFKTREISPASIDSRDDLLNFKSLNPIWGRIKTTTSGTLKLKITYYATPAVGLGWTVLNNSSLKVKKLDTFTNFQPSSGEANTGTNVGGEKEVYKSMSGTALQFRTLKEGTNVTLTQNTNDITIDVAGGGFWDGSVVVTADESNTTTTLVDSSYLTIPLDATSTYLVKAVVYMDDASSSKELRGNFAYTGSIDYSGIKSYNNTLSSNILTSNSFYLFNKPKGYMIEVTGMITTTTSGNLKIQFQLASGTGTVYLRKGSILYYKKVV